MRVTRNKNSKRWLDAVTRDKSASAQFEHSIGITETGAEIFTSSAIGYKFPPYIKT